MTQSKRPWSPPQIIWSALIAIVAWTALGFSWFGHGFDWTTKGNADKMAASAVTQSMASICVAQARNAPDAKAAIAELAGLSRWKRAEFVEEARWSTMPGGESPPSDVAELCATRLIES